MSHRLTARDVLAIFAFWTFLALLTAASRWLDPRGFGFRDISPAGPLTLPFIEAWLWAALTPAIWWLGGRVGLERNGLAARILILVAAGLCVAIIVYATLSIARDEILDIAHRRPFHLQREIATFRYVPQLLYYFAILAAGFAREYFLSGREEQARAAQLQAQLAGARLDALRAQIHPHFLFNTLHAISAMVERNPAGVRKMIARLSELLRHSIDANSADEVPLRDELALLDKYLDIMEIRFQGKLTVERSIDESTLDALVPDLILQPIVENALEHGVSRAKGEGIIQIAAQQNGNELRLRVHDNGPGVAGDTRGGVGLSNTRARLAQLYGDAAELRLISDNGTTAELTLPFRRSNA